MKSLKIYFLDKRKTEFVTSAYCILWGIWLLLPWDSFSTSEVFRLMANLAPEWVWGIFVLSSGIFHLTAVISNNLKTSLIASLITLFTFTILFVLTAFSNYKATAVVTYFTLLVCSWHSYIELLLITKKKV